MGVGGLGGTLVIVGPDVGAILRGLPGFLGSCRRALKNRGPALTATHVWENVEQRGESMKTVVVWTLSFLAGANLFGNSHGLKSLRCFPVSGHTYSVEINESELLLVESWVDTAASKSTLVAKVRHAFPLESCTFTPFSVALGCQDPADKNTSLKISLKRLSEKSTAHQVEFLIQGITEISSKTFETRRIDFGKSARCTVNETFEVL